MARAHRLLAIFRTRALISSSRSRPRYSDVRTILMRMRTTVDLDEGMLARARKRALEERRTLSAVVSEALAAHLATKRTKAK